MDGGARTPLSHHVLFQSRDLDEAREAVARVYKPHFLSIVHRGDRLDAAHHHVPVGKVSFNYLRYGATVEIDPGPLESFFLVQMPIAGRCDVTCGGESLHSDPSVASVVSPTFPFRQVWGGDCEKVMVQLNRGALERHLEQLCGTALRGPLEFDLALDLDGETGRSWRSFVLFVCRELDHERSLLASPLAVAQLEQLTMTALLLGQPHNQRAVLDGATSPAAPYYVKRVEDYIRAHAHEPIRIADLVAASGVSARSLYAGFRRFRGIGPNAYLKSVRLEEVRRELANPGAAGVTEIAVKWGFSHHGEFAADYRKRFGERPSQTLRRGR
jgi:AraC-like DNA-binding protein